MHRKINSEALNSFVESQLQDWPLASDNFTKLREVRRKQIPLGEFDSYIQCNPARIVSTGAKVDKDAIASRRCFLCAANRPAEQHVVEILDGWEFLLNPYPILPMHFTIAAKEHVPQTSIPLDLAAMTEKAPELVFFFNGARAGASAPDHMHTQAVLSSELPILHLAEKFHPLSEKRFMSSEDFGIELPFHFISAVIPADLNGMKMLAKISNAFGIDETTGNRDKGLVNAFFWMDNTGYLRVIVVPRRRHRPSCYNASGDDNYMISPGCIDMAGIMVCPRAWDFERLNATKIKEIYSEVAFANKLPQEIKEHFTI